MVVSYLKWNKIFKLRKERYLKMSKKNRKIQISMEDNHANVFSNGNGFDLIDLIVTLPEEVKQDFEKRLGFKIRETLI